MPICFTGCTVNASVCGKSLTAAKSQDNLTEELIGLTRVDRRKGDKYFTHGEILPTDVYLVLEKIDI